LRVIDDGRYDAFILSADAVSTDARDDAHRDARVALALTITSGAHKGDVVELLASKMSTRDPIDCIGLPCTLVVVDGVPHIEP
jgi:hypothetical protein